MWSSILLACFFGDENDDGDDEDEGENERFGNERLEKEVFEDDRITYGTASIVTGRGDSAALIDIPVIPSS